MSIIATRRFKETDSRNTRKKCCVAGIHQTCASIVILMPSSSSEGHPGLLIFVFLLSAMPKDLIGCQLCKQWSTPMPVLLHYSRPDILIDFWQLFNLRGEVWSDLIFGGLLVHSIIILSCITQILASTFISCILETISLKDRSNPSVLSTVMLHG